MRDFVYVHRKALDTYVFSNAFLWKLWCWCILRADWEWRPEGDSAIFVGTFQATRSVSAAELNTEPIDWQRGMRKLQALGELTIEHHGPDITVTMRSASEGLCPLAGCSIGKGKRGGRPAKRLTRESVSPKTRFDVFLRDGFACQYCGRKPPEVTLNADHVVPVSKGGTSEPGNLITACTACNGGKSATELVSVTDDGGRHGR